MTATRKRPSPSYSEATRPKRARIVVSHSQTLGGKTVIPRIASLSSKSTSVVITPSSRHVPRSFGHCATPATTPISTTTSTSDCSPQSSRPHPAEARSQPPSDPNSSPPYSSSTTTPKSKHLSDRAGETGPEVELNARARLDRQCKDAFDRVWSGNMSMFRCLSGPYEAITRFGLWTGSRQQFSVLMDSHSDLGIVYRSVHRSGHLQDIYMYRKSKLCQRCHAWRLRLHSGLLQQGGLRYRRCSGSRRTRLSSD